MNPDEILALHNRLDTFEAKCNERFIRMERMLWLVVGVGIGSGALTLTQFMGV